MEFITQWPPPPSETQPPPAKRARSRQAARLMGPDPTEQHASTTELEVCEECGLGSSSEDGLDPWELGLAESDCALQSDVLLARWWKLRQGAPGLKERVPTHCDPKTTLYHIARLPQCRVFIQHRVCHLKKELSRLNASSGGGSAAEVHLSLASCLHRLGDCQQAVEHAEKGLSLSKDEQQQRLAAWTCELLRRQITVQEMQKKASENLSSVGLPLSMPNPIQVERRSGKDFSFKEFFVDYALTHTPVVITGEVEEMTAQPWTFDHLSKVIGHMTAPLKRMVSGSVQWARLESAGQCTVEEFIESLDNSSPESDKLRCKYLFDWSLPLHCPELLGELTVPRFFASDFLQRAPAGCLYRDSWPSLFIAPSGVTSELHVDAFGSNFWMALFQGRKRWLFFPPSDAPLLYPVLSHSTDAVFEATLGCPSFSQHPLVALTHPRECVLEAGELLFVPAGCPHRVENLERSLAISANYVDLSNFEAVCAELRVNSLLDARSAELLQCFQAESFIREMEEQQRDLPWRDFKTWPRSIAKSLQTHTH